MNEVLKTTAISIVMVVITIIGDFYIKKASLLSNYSGYKLVILGSVLYASCAIGWFWVYRTTKFFTVGAIHSFGIIVLTTVLSVAIFKEKINTWEIVGLILGVISLTILLRNGNA